MKKKNCDAYVAVLAGGYSVLKCRCGFEVRQKGTDEMVLYAEHPAGAPQAIKVKLKEEVAA